LRPCILIPHYNHECQVRSVIAALAQLRTPVIIVDDGSDPASFASLQEAAAGCEWIELQRHQTNRGKGAAVFTGLHRALERGFTHACQLDADGQHRVADVIKLLDVARRHPAALVSGLPLYDDSVPLARLRGRKISVFWAQVNTWSRDIQDPMCGFRVYPVEATLTASGSGAAGSGMEFDTEILVRAHWAGMPILFAPTPVTYPADGVSHFRMVRDNIRISFMHTRLFFGMLGRAPVLAGRLVRRRLQA